MVLSLHLILAGVFMAALFEHTLAEKYCDSKVLGQLNTELVVEKPIPVDVGDTEAVVNIASHLYGCNTVGIVAIACDEYEEPVVDLLDFDHVVVRRNLALAEANVTVIRFCTPVAPNNLQKSRGQYNFPVLPKWTVGNVPASHRFY